MARRKVPPKSAKIVLDSNEIKKEGFKKTLRVWFKRLVLGLAVVVIVSIGMWVYEQWRYYVTPLNASAAFDSGDIPAYEWDGEHQLVIGMWLRQKDSALYRNAIVLVEPAVSMIDIVFLPTEVSTKDVDELSQQVGVPIDRHVVQKSQQSIFDPTDEAVLKNHIISWHQSIQGVNSYLGLPGLSAALAQQVFTDLSPRDLLIVSRLAQRLAPDDIRIHAWPQDSLGVEKLRREVLVDSHIVSESLRMWVRNTTPVGGLGGTISSWAKNLGFEIVRVDNADCRTLGEIACDGEQTVILTRPEHQGTWSINRLEKLLGTKSVVSTGEDIKRADVIVLTGNDLSSLVAF